MPVRRHNTAPVANQVVDVGIGQQGQKTMQDRCRHAQVGDHGVGISVAAVAGSTVDAVEVFALGNRQLAAGKSILGAGCHAASVRQQQRWQQ